VLEVWSPKCVLREFLELKFNKQEDQNSINKKAEREEKKTMPLE
jgi:hypothetical protein